MHVVLLPPPHIIQHLWFSTVSFPIPSSSLYLPTPLPLYFSSSQFLLPIPSSYSSTSQLLLSILLPTPQPPNSSSQLLLPILLPTPQPPNSSSQLLPPTSPLLPASSYAFNCRKKKAQSKAARENLVNKPTDFQVRTTC